MLPSVSLLYRFCVFRNALWSYFVMVDAFALLGSSVKAGNDVDLRRAGSAERGVALVGLVLEVLTICGAILRFELSLTRYGFLCTPIVACAACISNERTGLFGFGGAFVLAAAPKADGALACQRTLSATEQSDRGTVLPRSMIVIFGSNAGTIGELLARLIAPRSS